MVPDDSDGGPVPIDGPGVHGFKIRIDRQDFVILKPSLTGAELRKRADISDDRDLFEVVPGGSDLKIELMTVVQMRDGLRFFTAPAQINPGR